ACPAAGPRSFSNDWGAPRGGGRRRHKGNDIFAAHGSPAAAVVDGRISRISSGGLGGLSIYLWGDDGNQYYYTHMSGFATSTGQRVSAGQTIAYVGNTGNARGGAPHIHFEIHPGGGAPINPYYSLIRVC
ncbi:MAG TPA: M23 family metallopeptidase, partial [Actinomycetota bacterium]|nr:M23 family metallopeptidase [Actinomycetota bacterium]